MTSIIPYKLPRVCLVLASVLALSAGCGSGSNNVVTEPTDKAEHIKENSLLQLGDVYRIRQEESAPPPASVADITKYEKAYPLACGKVKSGDIVVFYGVPLEEGVGDTILAYEKVVPESGGHVLMQDGKTIKKMTPDEFKAAKKAAKG